jgi:tetratricopeptide (TPR) repeat protein
LYTTYQPHLILTLDKFEANFGRDAATYEDEYGFRSRTTNFDLIVASTWSLYDSTGAVVDRAIMQQEDFYDVRAVALSAALTTAGPVINRLAVETGYRFWDRLYPQPILLVRQVHQGRALNDAVFMLQTQQFQQAINVLLPIAQDASARQSTKAAHNLAVAYEAAGNYEQAINWARQAESRGDRLAENLIELWTGAGIIK